MDYENTLLDFVDIVSGMAFRSDDADPCGMIPVVRALDIKACETLDDFSNLKKIDEIPTRSPAIVKDDNILFVSRATFGNPFKACLVKTDIPLVASSSIYILQVHSKLVMPEFLSYYLNSNLFQKKLIGSVAGSTICHISKKALGEIRISLPSLEQQKTIIELKKNIKRQAIIHERQKALKEQVMQAIFNNLDNNNHV